MTDLPIACTLTPNDLRDRRADLLPALLERADSHEPLADGYRIRFKPGEDVLAAIAQTIEAERHCCRFLRFVVTVEADEGPILLEVTGPRGTREFLEGLVSA
jgi:hypothetical protein